MSNWSASMRAEIFFPRLSWFPLFSIKLASAFQQIRALPLLHCRLSPKKSPEAAVTSASLLGPTTPMLAVISPVYNLPSAVRKVFAGMSRSTKFGLPPDPSRGMLFSCSEFYTQYYSFGSWLDQNPEIYPLLLIASVTSVIAHSHLTSPKGISFGIDYFATNNNFWDSTGSTCTFRAFSERWISYRFCK